MGLGLGIHCGGLGLLAALAFAVGAAAQQAPSTDIVLDLDTGGHRAVIRALAVSPDGSTLYSASDDKTVRVWDWQAQTATAVLRGQIGPGAEGLVNALAISADGQALAVAGYFGKHLASEPPFGDVRIFDTRSGRILRVLKGHDYVVDSLAYDAGRDELAASGQNGMVHRWAHPFGADEPVALPVLDSESRRVMAVGYAAGGSRIVAATFDYGLKLWDADTGAAIAVPDAEPLWDVPLVALAVSADGSRFAVAGEDGRVELRAAADGSLLAALPPQDFRPDALAFTEADSLLTVSCGYRCGETHRTTAWDLASLTPRARDFGPEGGTHAAIALPDGHHVALAGGRIPEIGVVAPATGATLASLEGIGAPISAVAISRDGTHLALGSEDPLPGPAGLPEVAGPLDRQMQLPSLDFAVEGPKPAEAAAAGWERAIPAEGPTRLTPASTGGGFEADALTIARGPQEVTLRKDAVDGYYFSSFGLVPGADQVITGGGNGVLLAQSTLDGRVMGEFVGHTGDVLALALAPRAGRLLTGSADQTLKLWNLETRALIASIFVSGADWIVWTPRGYFQSSPDGDRLVGWQLNQGPDREARFIKARQLRQHLHSPEIVRRALITGDASGAAKELRGTDTELFTLLSRPAPDFQIAFADDVKAPEGMAVIELTGATIEDLEDWGFSVLVNDRRVPPLRMPDGAGRVLYQVPVQDGANNILVTGENDFGYVTERSAERLFKLTPKAAEKKGKLFVAVVGITDYPELADGCGGKSCDLAYPAADAIEFLRTVKTHTAPLFEGMETLVLANADALTRAPLSADALTGLVDPAEVQEPESSTITDALIDFLARPGPDDTTIIFIASHGLNIGERFFLIPSNGQRRGDDWRQSSLVDWEVVQEEIGYAQGRRILLLDTCHAANAYNAKLEKDAADAVVIVFSATAANNTAQERADLQHGVFTYALIQGLGGAADSGDGVWLLSLADYVYREVIKLSRGKQEPFYHISQTANFLLALK